MTVDGRAHTHFNMPKTGLDDNFTSAYYSSTGKYDPCVAPADIVAKYKAMKAADPSRPVRLGLGQGVAWTDWGGRGTCTNHTEMYSEYADGGDSIGYDIYPRNLDTGPCAGRLECVALGLDNLRRWSGGSKPLFMSIETGPIRTLAGPSPADVRAEVWMSIVHGAARIVYFVHSWAGGKLDEAHLLHEPAMLAEVTQIHLTRMQEPP